MSRKEVGSETGRVETGNRYTSRVDVSEPRGPGFRFLVFTFFYL